MEYSYKLELARKNTIDFWGRYVIADLQKSIRNKNIGRTHSLISNLGYQYKPDGSGDGTVELHFNYYGKMLDMGVGKGRKIEDVKFNREVYRVIGQKNKSNKWLSKVAFTQISALRHIMQEKFGEDAANIIKESITNKINF